MSYQTLTTAVFPDGKSVSLGYLDGIELVVFGICEVHGEIPRIIGFSPSHIAQKSPILRECHPHFVKLSFFDALPVQRDCSLVDFLHKNSLSDEEILNSEITYHNLVWYHPVSEALFTSRLQGEATMVVKKVS